MPIFEFKCLGCSRQFEDIMTTAELEAGDVDCPHCGSRDVERMLSGFAMGSGAASGPACGAPRGGCGTGGFG